MKILTAEQMRDADRLTAERYGIPTLQLMENAGAAISDYLCTTYLDLAARQVLVLCGKGNNGGDGLVVARRLRQRGVSPRVILFAEPSAMKGDAAVNLKSWQQGMGDLRIVTSKSEWDVARDAITQSGLIVDALLGTGLNGPVEGLLAYVIGDVNAAARRIAPSAASGLRRLVVAVDMPSGLPSGEQDFGGPVIEADVTVTLTAPKLGQMVSPRSTCVGKLVVRGIGTPPDLLDNDSRLKLHWLEPGEFRGLPLMRERDSNKGSFGHALVVAGSLGKSGAALLAGRSALRAGAGLVTVGTPFDILPIVAAGMPELMTAPLASTEQGSVSLRNLDHGAFAEIEKGKAVLAIGPGMSTNDQTQQFIRAVVEKTPLPTVLDADGLNAFDQYPDALKIRTTRHLAITPHPGEMARLLGATVRDVQARRLEIATDAAARWNAYVILKGFHTILATPDGRAYVNTTGNPGMATGGTGDVLTGMLAGLTAQFGPGKNVDKNSVAWESVLGMGIYLHGLAGDMAAQRVGEAPLVASDLIDALPAAYAQLLTEWDRARA
jgi:NAD(P)H-hydrate epimerase